MSLLLGRYDKPDLPEISPDPFTDDQALHEATLLNVLYLGLWSTLAILFDLRTAMNIGANGRNVGVLVFHGVSQVAALGRGTASPGVWLVGDVSTLPEDDYVRVTVGGLVHHEEISVKAQSAELLVGFVEGIGEIAAEIEDESATAYLQTIPDWKSIVRLTGIANVSI